METTTRLKNSRAWRSRWAAAGAAIAVSLGGGGLFVANAAPSVPSSVVAIEPTRILDTRTDVGLAGPFVPGEAQKLQVTGSVATQPPPPAAAANQVVVPATATSVNMNVTVVGPQTGGFLSIRPGDATGTPATSNINFGAGGANVANSVSVQLPAAGDIDIYVSGTVAQVLIDVVGYTDPASAGPAGPQGEQGIQGVQGEQGEPGPANLVPFSVQLSIGESETIATAGPLSMVADCVDNGGGDYEARILGQTSVDDGVVQIGDDDTFDGGAVEGFLLPATLADDRVLSSNEDDETNVDVYIDGGALLDQSGNYIGIDGETTALGVYYDGADCVFVGTYTFIIPVVTP